MPRFRVIQPEAPTLYITPSQVRSLRAKAEMPRGLVYDQDNRIFHVSKDHPDHDALVSEYGTEEAKRKFTAHFAAVEQSIRRKLEDPEAPAIPPEDRVYLFVRPEDGAEAMQIGARFDRTHEQGWYVDAGNSNLEAIKKRFASPEAEALWLQSQQARRERRAAVTYAVSEGPLADQQRRMAAELNAPAGSSAARDAAIAAAATAGGAAAGAATQASVAGAQAFAQPVAGEVPVGQAFEATRDGLAVEWGNLTSAVGASLSQAGGALTGSEEARNQAFMGALEGLGNHMQAGGALADQARADFMETLGAIADDNARLAFFEALNERAMSLGMTVDDYVNQTEAAMIASAAADGAVSSIETAVIGAQIGGLRDFISDSRDLIVNGSPDLANAFSTVLSAHGDAMSVGLNAAATAAALAGDAQIAHMGSSMQTIQDASSQIAAAAASSAQHAVALVADNGATVVDGVLAAKATAALTAASVATGPGALAGAAVGLTLTGALFAARRYELRKAWTEVAKEAPAILTPQQFGQVASRLYTAEATKDSYGNHVLTLKDKETGEPVFSLNNGRSGRIDRREAVELYHLNLVASAVAAGVPVPERVVAGHAKAAQRAALAHPKSRSTRMAKITQIAARLDMSHVVADGAAKAGIKDVALPAAASAAADPAKGPLKSRSGYVTRLLDGGKALVAKMLNTSPGVNYGDPANAAQHAVRRTKFGEKLAEAGTKTVGLAAASVDRIRTAQASASRAALRPGGNARVAYAVDSLNDLVEAAVKDQDRRWAAHVRGPEPTVTPPDATQTAGRQTASPSRKSARSGNER